MQHVSISKDKNFREALKPIARFLRFTNLLLYMLVLKINYNDFSNNDREILTSRRTAIFLSAIVNVMIIHRFLFISIDTSHCKLQVDNNSLIQWKKKSKKKWIIKDFVSRFNPLLISYYIREIIYPLKRRTNFIKH